MHVRAALAIACMALATRCAGHNARELLVQECRGFEQVPVPMTEDINLFVDVKGSAGTLQCTSVSTNEGGQDSHACLFRLDGLTVRAHLRAVLAF